jgi:hypothetical protein
MTHGQGIVQVAVRDQQSAQGHTGTQQVNERSRSLLSREKLHPGAFAVEPTAVNEMDGGIQVATSHLRCWVFVS